MSIMQQSSKAQDRTLTEDFNGFLRDRAKLLFAAMNSLTAGNSPSLEELWSAHFADTDSTPLGAEV